MRAEFSRRVAAWLAGLWAGQILALGLIAAPAAFAVLARADAGRLAARLFQLDAHVTVVLAAVLVLLERRTRGGRAAGAPVFGTNLLLVLAALFCTVAGYFAIEPMMAEARAGRGTWSFAALHGISAAFFLAKALVVSALAWRHARRTDPSASAPPAS